MTVEGECALLHVTDEREPRRVTSRVRVHSWARPTSASRVGCGPAGALVHRVTAYVVARACRGCSVVVFAVLLRAAGERGFGVCRGRGRGAGGGDGLGRAPALWTEAALASRLSRVGCGSGRVWEGW